MTAPPEKTRVRQVTGQWSRGQSGNPAGRPRGARNRTTLAAESLLDGEAEKLTRRCIELALEGDATALRLCLEWILPPRRELPLSVEIELSDGIEGIAEAEKNLIQALASGRLTPAEAVVVMGILKTHRETLSALKLAEAEKLLESLRATMEGES